MKIEYESLRSELTDEELYFLKLLEKSDLSTKEVSNKTGTRQPQKPTKQRSLLAKILR